jgi:hypothetical protein
VADLHNARRPRRPPRVGVGHRRDRRTARVAYVGTGQAYSRPRGPLTDALLALRLKDGSPLWHRQFTRNDVWNASGDLAGKDRDIGVLPNLFRIGRRDVSSCSAKAGVGRLG